MSYKRIIFSGHAIRKMFNRGLTKNGIMAAIKHGEIIIDYPDDNPYPSSLILGYIKDVPVHVILAIDTQKQSAIVVTAYVPDAKLWSDDFKTRRK
jgi:hypothetical protein